MIPNNDDMLIFNELDYICVECKTVMTGHEIGFQKMPSNFNIEGLDSESEIPKCSHCGTLAFFGMKEFNGMRKLTRKQIRKDRMRAFVEVLNCWYVNQHLLDPKHACYLFLIVER